MNEILDADDMIELLDDQIRGGGGGVLHCTSESLDEQMSQLYELRIAN